MASLALETIIVLADEVRKERNKALKKDAALRLAGMIHKVQQMLFP